MPSPVLHGPGRPSWGFTPLQRHRRRDPHDPGLPHPARSVLGVSRPLDGFLSLRPRGHARSAAAPGVQLATLFRTGRPLCVAAPLHPLAYGALQPRTLRNTRSKAPQTPRCLSLTALVPRPWFQSLGAPSGAHHLRAVAAAFAAAIPSRARALGVWANHDASDRHLRVFHQPASQRIYWRSAAPMGFLLHPEDALAPPGALLRQAPACPPEPDVFRGV
jgi:hypothetical protein